MCPHRSGLRGGPQLSAPFADDLRAAVRAAKTARGVSWPTLADTARVPRGSMQAWMYAGQPLRLEWAARLAGWCGLELTLAPSRAPSGLGEFGDPLGDEGEEAS